MPTLPLWAIGKHVTSCLLTPQVVNATTGAMTDTTPTVQFYGHLQEVSLNLDTTFENISAMDRPFENNVPVETAATLKLTELEVFAGTNLAAYCANLTSYWKYVLTRGAQSWTGYGILASYNMNGTKPKITADLELKMIDVGNTAAIAYG